MRHAKTVFASLALGGVLASGALGQAVPRTSATDKGSLIVFPKVDVRGIHDEGAPGGWRLVTDTFVDLSNDYPRDVGVQMYFVNGELPNKGRFCQPGSPLPPDPEARSCSNDNGCQGEGDFFCERAHLGWNWVDVKIELTAHQPVYWSAASGSNLVSPFTILDPRPSLDRTDPPGRPCDDGTGLRCLRGFVIAFATNEAGVPIRWNHLKGDALVVHYEAPSGPGAYSYNAYAFGALWPDTDDDNDSDPNGEVYPEFVKSDDDVTQVELIMNGALYEACPNYLLYDFYAEESQFLEVPLGPQGQLREWVARNSLTLLPMDIDLTQETEGPTLTKASFTVWNENEIKLTGQHRCIECWEQEVISNYFAPNHLLRENLGTNKGKAQIDGIRSQNCERPCGGLGDDDCRHGEICRDDPNDSCHPDEGDSDCPGLCQISKNSAMLGIAEMDLFQISAQQGLKGKSAHNLVGVGDQICTIKVDIASRPPPEIATEPSADPSTARTGSMVQPIKLTPRSGR